jgi:very-short-patch-repair endonuclease
VSHSWRRRAERRASRAELPLVPNLEPATQLEQLALALGPHELVLVVASDGGANLASFVAAVRWAASQPAVRVVALVPESVDESPDLVAIAAEKVRFEKVHILDGGETHVVGVWTIAEDGQSVSQGELVLRHRLKVDPELGHLFAFNQRVSTRFNNSFQVDAVWPEGKVCVEVDGRRFHAKAEQFCRDRQRDFEMMVSGYLVLRIPHDEVVDDSQKALEKVRAMVRFRREGEKSRE